MSESCRIIRNCREARRRHKALGYPIVIMRGGKDVEVPPEEIEV